MIILKLLAAVGVFGLVTLLVDLWAHSKASKLILHLLAEEDWRYGLELVKASDGNLRRGSIYHHLGQMEDSGLVVSVEEQATPEHIGIPRRLYRITVAGLARLEEQS